MYCPRLNHFRRIMPDGKIGLCGHMTNQQSFAELNELESSNWLADLKQQMSNDIWPTECQRCQQEELLNQNSIRQNSIQRDKILSTIRNDYLIVGGVLDNICNAACQFCSENLSTKIGSLKYGNKYKLINNYDVFVSLPQDRIVELDINGGEPSNSPNYLKLLQHLPPNVKIVRVNTNASRYIKDIENLLDNGIKVIITLSLDGTKQVYEYARWPLKWKTFIKVVDQYRQLRDRSSLLNLDFWTTVSAYTVGDLTNIEKYASDVGINLSMGRLKSPWQLDVRYLNPLTKDSANLPDVAVDKDNTKELFAYIKQQDLIRGTNYEDCFTYLKPS